MSETPETSETAIPRLIAKTADTQAPDPTTAGVIDDILTRNRIEVFSLFDAERKAGAPTSGRVKLFIIASAITILLGIVPVFLAPLLLDRTPHPTTTSQVLAALSAFSASRDGHSAKSSLVREVTAYSRVTVSGATTVYALPAGSLCYGVVVTNTVAGPAQIEPASACN
jgi:hypothetical protein